MEKLKHTLIHFLNDNNIYDIFFNALEIQNKITFHNKLTKERFLNTYIDYSNIHNVFIFLSWSMTREGFYYWYEIHRKWQQKLFKEFLPIFIHTLKKHNLYECAMHQIYKDKSLIEALKTTSLKSYPARFFYCYDYTNLNDTYKKLSEDWENTLSKI